MDKNIENALRAKSKQYGIPFEFTYAVVMTESEGNMHAVGDNGKSHGLFQIYTVAHPDYNVARGKKDVNYQIDYWLPTLASTYEKGKSKGLKGLDLALYIEKYGERPKWTQMVINRVTKYYNEITKNIARLPVTGATEKNITGQYGEQRSDHIHKGVDIAMPLGTNVFTVFGGTVINTGYSSSYGNFVEVRNINQYREFFAHLSKINVSKNDVLSPGDSIGRVGSTGRSTGNHLHYEIRTVSGTKINPIEYLKQNTINVSSSNENDSTNIFNSIIDKVQNLFAGMSIYGMIIILMFVAMFFIFNKQKTLETGVKNTVKATATIVKKAVTKT